MFPTVVFPNPEEPGAMDRVIEVARISGAALALANDPDADRLGVAIPVGASWRLLRGDEIGWLLGDHVLRHTHGDDRLVVTTLVSSSLLGKMAASHGVAYEETFTGFKWIADAALRHSDKRLVFAYEQALGYLVANRPLDKDGIAAAVLMTEVAALALAEGTTVQGRLDQIAEQYGRHVTGELSVKMNPSDGLLAVDRLRSSPPVTIAGRVVVRWRILKKPICCGCGLMKLVERVCAYRCAQAEPNQRSSCMAKQWIWNQILCNRYCQLSQRSSNRPNKIIRQCRPAFRR
jgi:phosphomannomutase